MRIDWTTLALQTVNAIVLVWLLARFLFRPVASIIVQRQKTAQALVADASAAKLAAEALLETNRQEGTKRLADAHADALKAVYAEASAEKATLLAAARDGGRHAAHAGGCRTRAYACRRSGRGLGDGATLLAVDIAGKLLDRLRRARVSRFCRWPDRRTHGVAGADPGDAGHGPSTRCTSPLPVC